MPEARSRDKEEEANEQPNPDLPGQAETREHLPRQGGDSDGPEDEPTEALHSEPGEPPCRESHHQEEDELSQTRARLKVVSAAYKNLQEEMKAFRNRTERLQEERDRKRLGDAVATVFEPVQNLRRTLEVFEKNDLPEELVGGLRMVLDQFTEALERLGLEEIPCEGEPFDPNIHEAMGTVLVDDPSTDGIVVKAFDVGYRIGSLVIQPARVLLGRYQEPADND